LRFKAQIHRCWHLNRWATAISVPSGITTFFPERFLAP